MNALALSSDLAMSSREIAELVESRHDNVKVTIERLVSRGAIASPAMQEKPTAGRSVVEYLVGKRDSYVIVAQLSPEFTARLVDRWQELEAQVSAPPVPRSLAEALRLAANQAEEIERQTAQLEAQKPAVEFVGRYVDATGSKGFRDVCKLLRANERAFRDFLIDERILYRLDGRLVPFAQHSDAGRFEIKAGVTKDDNAHAFSQTRFTPKGIEWVAGKWTAHQLQQSGPFRG